LIAVSSSFALDLCELNMYVKNHDKQSEGGGNWSESYALWWGLLLLLLANI